MSQKRGSAQTLWCAACKTKVPFHGKETHEADGVHAKNVAKLFKLHKIKEAVAHQIPECPGPLVPAHANTLAAELD